MAKITPKENFLRLGYGEMPEYVPFYTFLGNEKVPEISSKSAGAGLFVTKPPNPDGSQTDIWGVTSYATEVVANAAKPDPRIVMLDDITKWRDVIKQPQYRDDLSREALITMRDQGFERAGLDRNMTALRGGCSSSLWLTLVGFMGFEGALVSMAEEPETVKELFDWIVSLYEPYAELVMDVFQPDIWTLMDDICHEKAPFFSVAMLRDIYKPFYERFNKPAIERGIPVLMHVCGVVEPFIEDFIDVGIRYVEPAQETNDIQGLKERFPNQMAYCGGFDWAKHIPKDYPEYDKDELRQVIEDYIDKYAPGGMFSSRVHPVSYPGDPALPEITYFVQNVAYDYGKKVYGYTD